MIHIVYALALSVFLAFAECHPLEVNLHPENEEELSSEDGTERWGYVNVRKRAHMFYWFYYTSHPDGYKKRPWIIWLQGGPGASSCGYGNFEILGPLKPDLSPRNTTWVKQASVLFIDAPVGSGFSYVDDPSAYNTKVSHIIDDLMKLLRVFLKKMPIFKTRPLYIFGESYGGKVTAYLSRRLYDEIQSGSIKVKLVGFAIGNGWISPLDTVLNSYQLAYWMSLIDEERRNWCQANAEDVKEAIDQGNWTLAVQQAWFAQGCVIEYSNHVDIYDLSKFRVTANGAKTLLDETMERLKKEKLRLIPANKTWSDTRGATFHYLSEHYMKPSVSVVDDLLQTTDLQVIVYQGQMDLIACTKAANDWVQQFKWSNLSSYNESYRTAFRNPDDNQTESFVKAFGKFKFYNILGAGHMVPRDKGDAAYRMLDRILNNLDQ